MENYNNSSITQTLNLSDAEHTKQQSMGGIKRVDYGSLDHAFFGGDKFLWETE